jgi:hypothetical protein
MPGFLTTLRAHVHDMQRPLPDLDALVTGWAIAVCHRNSSASACFG